MSALAHAVPPLAVGGELYDYQREGVAWIVRTLRRKQAALLADEMGVGKSAQAIVAASQANNVFDVLVVCPAIVVSHWHAQIERWAPSHVRPTWRVLSYEGFVRAAKGGTKKIPPLGRHDMVILDEIHYLMNERSQRSRAVRAWLAAQRPRPVVLGLSGTPMTARPRDLWCPLDTLFPGSWETWWYFTIRYCAGHWRPERNAPKGQVWDSDGVSHADELHERLRDVMLRRTKTDVQLELPPRTRVPIDVPTTPGIRRTIDWTAAPEAYQLRSSGAEISRRLAAAEPFKADSACALAREIQAEGARPLILTTRVETAKRIAEELGCPCVHGEIPPTKRRDMISEAPVAVATMYSVTTGIDLVGFDSAIFVGLDWVPSTLLQAEARIHRIGQTKPVTVYYLCAQGTLDEIIRARVIERLETFTAIVGSGDEAGLAGDLAQRNQDLLAQILHDAGVV
jgi:SWI/SNF-related matrix-associated actin-dependent regulator 1 of chromatin subfamily A